MDGFAGRLDETGSVSPADGVWFRKVGTAEDVLAEGPGDAPAFDVDEIPDLAGEAGEEDGFFLGGCVVLVMGRKSISCIILRQ